MKTWTLKVETMTGTKRTIKIKARNLDQAIDGACRVVRVGNLLEAWQGKARWM